MGVSMAFISATTEELERAEKDPGWADAFVGELYDGDAYAKRPHDGPGKAWADLQFLLDGADVGLEFLMDGDQLLEDGTLFAWSAEQIESVARELQATPWERLAVHYDAERMKQQRGYPPSELDWLEGPYEELVAFFAEAAAGGYGAFMTFSF
ncbi:DUF1877 family protein [Streptomyces sp. NPDC101393]|uniref:DUF1877 family protein n=1 Tax=Streptomyces sp. NPDC101393 TaxID=3366141 RepID=UPI003818940B